MKSWLRALLLLLFLSLSVTAAQAQNTLPRENAVKEAAKSTAVPNCTGGQVLVNGACQCRPNFYWNARMNQCRPVRTCPPGQHFDRESDNCVQDVACTGGQVLVNGACRCRPNFYWNARMNQCRPVRTCPPGQHFNRESDSCVQDVACTGGQVLVNGACQCRPNFYWNARMNQCRPVRTCPPGQHFNRESDSCVAK